MRTIKNAQARIKNTVKLYEINYPREYRAVCDAVEMKKRMTADEFAQVQGSYNIQRALYEIPEDMMSMFIHTLDEGELEYLKTKEGARWFAKAHPQFALPQNV